MAQLTTGPLHVSADQWNDIREHYEDPDDWDDAILAEELGLDEPRCPRCGHPSTGLCVDCAPTGEDSHLESDYEDRVSGGLDYDGYFDRWDDDASPYSGTYSEE
jgi:hypothetical protein